MKKFFYGISVFFFLCILWAGYYGAYRMTELNRAKANTAQFLKLGREDGNVSVREVSGEFVSGGERNGEAEGGEEAGGEKPDEVYYLKEKDGYVTVYLQDRVTVYESTSIFVNLLPASVRKEIMEGKYVKSREELYGFLENYSS